MSFRVNNTTTAVILAGGLGTRLQSVVSDRPKPMALVNGRPFLEHLIKYWIAQGVKRFIISVGYMHSTILDYFGDCFLSCKIVYIIESFPLGTGGALINVLKETKLSERFLLLNGDTYFEANLKDLEKVSYENDSDWTFSLFVSEDRMRYKPVILDRHNILKFDPVSEEYKKGKYLVNGGIYLVHPRSLKAFMDSELPISLEETMFSRAVDCGQVFTGVLFNKLFIDIGMPHDYSMAQTLFPFR
ncbi:D-glycero-alpha-D-manno-heptose 1-phosphate guanylyltransferase [Prochlorococcus marinus str. MIT 1342]|uniref:sugar phosphate nucleotidyltransferase n=1 Tax=Prochlorococcus TaxID=1218 RepID=UPI0007B3E3AD|nr:sugar phosphate nucleotidyltransferase [Prochlorococcus marinus]KZR79931.1 D-glycero-alpha-D-manno-heptose 1-phosphate guanylyltransferase [Prochlorococcus marinus str. MIT 1342]